MIRVGGIPLNPKRKTHYTQNFPYNSHTITTFGKTM